MPFIEALAQQAGSQAAGNFINEAMGIATQPIKNKQEQKQYRALQNISLEGEMTRLQRNQAAALQMWKDTSYPAQMEMMQKAGLNPALMYGMGGGGGQTASVSPGATSGGGSGVARASGGAEHLGIQVGQMQLLKAQKENIEADTALKNATAEKTAGVDTEKGNTEIRKLKEEIKNVKVLTGINNLEERIKEIDLNIKSQTSGDQMGQIVSMAEIAARTAELLDIDQQISAETKEEKKGIIRAEAIGAVLRNALTRSQTANTQQQTAESRAQINKWAQELQQGWRKLDYEGKRLKIEALSKQMEVEKGYDWKNVRYHYSEREFIDIIDQIMGGKQ